MGLNVGGHKPKSVPVLGQMIWPDEHILDEVVVDGANVVVPHSCGSDGNEHRFGTACILGERDNLVLYQA